MTFNLFGPPTKDDIRVGYVDPNLGFVEGFTICEANEYAIKNPGTTFVFRNGNNIIQYLNVNEVNQLDPNVLVSTDECGGINQKKECGPPKIQLFGGGGVGAAGNPIIGRDGALLAVDIVRGGNGYQYPPIVAARDDCNYGAGATLTAILGEVTETIETYENESDFEDYELCEDTDVGYGRRYGPDGEDLGAWEPKLYTDPGQDPIRKEVEEFEKIVRRLARTPFWSTRSVKPTKITSSNTRTIPQKYDVTDKTYRDFQDRKGNTGYVALGQVWSKFMNTYAISPVSPSSFPGTDYATDLFIFEWEEEFPHDGEYIFRGSADGAIKQLYIDNLNVGTLSSYNEAPKLFKKTISKGIHKIRLDLLNGALDALSTVETRKVFDTLNFSGKANRTLWRVKPFAEGTSGFTSLLTKSGILPFDPDSSEAQRQNYGGEHLISWSNINFPIDGIYTIEFAVDDAIDLTIGDFKIVASGNDGRRWREITKTHFFKAGTYSINAVLKQSFQGALSRGNPMGFAMQITVGEIVSGIVSPNSWNNNPMGVSLTIDAPEPTVPKEPAPVQEGRCPPNPIWTTRFPGAKETWYPVKFNGSKSPQGKKDPWGKFFNRYAISPVRPLDTPGSDAGGIVFTNSWELDIPYDGFYKFAVERDNTARIYVDGNLAFDIKTSGDDIWRDFRNKPKFQKVFIAKGRHTIGIELQNTKTESFSQISQKIFRTKDWQTSAKPVASTLDVDFNVRTVKSSSFASSFKIADLGISVSKPSRTLINQNISKKVEVNKVYTIEIEVPQSKGITLQAKGTTLEVEDLRSSTARDLFVSVSRGTFFDVVNGRTKATCKFIIESGGEVNLTGLTGGTAKDGVTYEGPPLFNYKEPRWGEFMNNHSVSPLLPPLDAENPEINGVKKYNWKGVKFPESGQYDITFLADNDAKLIIGGKEVLISQGFAENPQTFKVNITQGTYNVLVECNNIPGRTSIFGNNPTGFGLVIRKNVSVRGSVGKSWDENPIGIGAILIPPPCPRRIRGRGVVTDVIVNDPGNGYLPPGSRELGYPVTLRLKQVIVENPGINYSGTDQIQITPSNSAILEPVFGPFGTVESVNVLNPGLGFTEYPQIRLISETGVNASFRPVFEVVRDPIVLPERLIQVTDLVGLKQTGYVDGRAYYGSVYYDQGVRYAGFYETVGDLVQVYDTLQESIAAEITTPPSAIQRQGTDITSNDPRLNIPGTPQNLI